MKNPALHCPSFVFLKVGVFLLLSNFLFGQSPCAENPNAPFGLSASTTICAVDNGLTTLSFTIYTGIDPGTYEVVFPDGTDTTFVDISTNTTVSRSFLFDCGNMPGDPIPPNGTNHYFSYQNQLLVTRLDCVDALGQYSVSSYDFNVVTNPINSFSQSNSFCIGAPFIVDFTSSICDYDLVDDYQWSIDGVPILDSIGMLDHLTGYSFPGAGSYTVSLEVSDYFGCGPFSYEEEITITALPSIGISLNIDSSQLCQSVITIDNILNNSLYADTYFWSSPSPDVTFSDPNIANPVITINNNTAGPYPINLVVGNADCGTVSQNFTITTFDQQSVNFTTPDVSCTQTEIDLCDFVDFAPSPTSVVWSYSGSGVTITNPEDPCPIVAFSEAGNFTLSIEGFDICNNEFSDEISIDVTPAQSVLIDIAAIDTLCETDTAVALLGYVAPSDYIVSCDGDGVVNCQFDPAGNIGSNDISFTDSCGNVHFAQIFVTAEGGFGGGDLTICVGDSINLFAIQSGNYSGLNVINNVFYSELAGIGTHSVDFTGTAFCGGNDQFSITVIDKPTADFAILNDPCLPNSLVFPLGETISLDNLSASGVFCYTVLETGEEICGNNTANFTFNASGDFTIQQIVQTSSAGCKDTISQTIYIEPVYTPLISTMSDTSDCDSVLIHFFVDQEIPGYQYLWTFDNGETSNETNPDVFVERPFLASDLMANLAIVTFCDTIYYEMEVGLPARFQISFDILNDNNTICSGETVYFQNTSGNYDSLSITYNFNNVSSIFLDSLVYHNTTDTIIYLEVIVEGFKANCPSITAIDTLVILPINTIAQFSMTYDDTPCSPFLVSLKNSSTPGAEDYVYWGDGSTPQQIGSLEEVEHEYFFLNDTTITITLTSALCGKDTIQKEVFIFGAPAVEFEYFPLDGQCENDSILFLPLGTIDGDFDLDWDFGDSIISHLPNPIHTFESGFYEVSLTITNTHGCASTYSLPIEIHGYSGVDLAVEVSDVLCENSLSDLTILSAENGIWIDYGNEIVSSEILPIPYQDEGMYFLNISTFDDHGCSQDTAVLISVLPPLSAMIIPDVIDTIVNLGDELLLDFYTNDINRGIEKIVWTGDAVSLPNSKITVVFPANDGFYDLAIEDEFGCLATDSIFVWVNKGYEESIYIPNAFTPNEDGRNDRFYIFAKSNIVAKIKTFQVFSNWGEKVFECNDCSPNNPDAGWDGYLDGKAMNPMVFSWLAEIEFIDGTLKFFKGDVTLLK